MKNLPFRMQVGWLMVAKDIPKIELARRMGIRHPGVSRLLGPGSNPTLRTMERVADALGMRLVVRLEPK